MAAANFSYSSSSAAVVFFGGIFPLKLFFGLIRKTRRRPFAFNNSFYPSGLGFAGLPVLMGIYAE